MPLGETVICTAGPGWDGPTGNGSISGDVVAEARNRPSAERHRRWRNIGQRLREGEPERLIGSANPSYYWQTD